MLKLLTPLWISLCAFATPLAAQYDSLSDYRESRIFHSIGFSFGAEVMTQPVEAFEHVYCTNPGMGPCVYDTIAGYRGGWAPTLLALNYEARKNLYRYYDRGSVSLSIPVAFSLNFWEIENQTRIGTFTLPVFVDANYGMHSTWNNIDKYGVHVGAGYQVVFAGLFGGFATIDPNNPADPHMLTWSQPVMRAGFKFPTKHTNQNRYLDFYWGFGSKKRYVDYVDQDSDIPVYKNVWSKFYCKVTFGFLIHYTN